MLNKLKYILDIGSSTLRLIATTKLAGKQRIIAEENLLYDGFMDGEFLSADELSRDLEQLVDGMMQKTKKQINSIIVGVPSEFCVCVCKRIARKYVGLKKITELDLKNLYQTNSNFGDSDDYVVISYSPMQCVLDDNFKTLSPVGKKTSTLTLDASYILAKKSFMELFKQKFEAIGIHNLDFVSSALGQAMTCEPVKNNQKPIAIVDVGHITTSVCVYKGEGLALLSSFAMGGGHISSDLMQVLNLGFKQAELIKRKVILTIESHKNEYYEVCSKGSLIKAPINMTNQVVKSRIEMISKVIKDILTIDDVFKDIDIYLTGDGISNFKGVKNILKDVTGLNVYEYKIPFNNSKDKFQTSKTGLASLAEIMV
ncbi:MAG: pilus assembly protein PilM [Clostridia bacterium]|nr:pilus assembly protein PilM [Clostridia bacterium]